MSRENRKLTVRRILVPLDESTHSQAALEAAVTMAAALEAEISGLYVEDVDLLELSKYPFFREVCTYECRPRKAEEIERDLRLQAERIRRMIARFAGNAEVTWTFEVRRGGVRTVVLEQTTAADLTIMGRTGRTVLRSTMGSTVRHLILHGRGLTMFIQEGFRLLSPVMVAYTGSDLGKKALDIAANIARLVNGQVEVLLPAGGRESFLEKKKEAEQYYADANLQVTFHPVHVPAARGLISRLDSKHRQLLVLPADTADGHPEDLLKLIKRINNPVLLVR